MSSSADDRGLWAAVEGLIAEVSGRRAAIVRRVPVSGGCINDGHRVELADGRAFFVKRNACPPPAMFEREAEGLAALDAVGAIRVPRPIGVGSAVDAQPFIILEWVNPGGAGRGFHQRFGRAFAELHRRSQAARFGFDHDNYLGSSPQPNGWWDDWVEFWREQRLGHQLRLARARGLSDPEMERLAEGLFRRLDQLIGQPVEAACLLHGDLWGGNYLVDRRGDPVLIDPAVYRGRREADLAMTLLFGGFDDRFHAAYREVWPLAPGAEDRLEIYKLYHLLNHLNLFGQGYRAACLAILRRFGR